MVNTAIETVPVTVLTGYLGAGKNHPAEPHPYLRARQKGGGHRQRVLGKWASTISW